jgi:DNA-binding response OmpR family regulator
MGKKLLIVDDEVDVRDFAANFFRKRKIDVETASSGEEVLQAVTVRKPDLMLLDITMSGIDGIETLKLIREKYDDIKVIMVTGKRPEENASAEECLKLGALAYIHKPLQLDELERIVMKEIQ